MTMQNWDNLSRWLVRARGGRTQAEVAEAAGVSIRAVQKYESGRDFDRPGRVLRKLADHYRWTPDSIDRALDGGEPTTLPPDPLAVLTAAASHAEPELKDVLLKALEAYPAPESVKKQLRRKINEMTD